MDMYGTLFTENAALTEQAARRIFSVVGEEGPVLVIMDNDGTSRPSDSHRFMKLGITEEYLAQLRTRIDDGHEPLVTEHDGCSIIGAQLSTERTNFGYVMIALQLCDPESILSHIDLVELLLNQFNVIASLIESNNRLAEAQNKLVGSACIN